MVAVTIYAEGGGRGKAGNSKFRENFRKFIEQAGLVGNMPAILACGSREDALKDFRVALKGGRPANCPYWWSTAKHLSGRKIDLGSICALMTIGIALAVLRKNMCT